MASRTRREQQRQARASLQRNVTYAQALERSVAAVTNGAHGILLGFLLGQYVLLDALSNTLLLEVYPTYAAPVASTLYVLLAIVLLSVYSKIADRSYDLNRWLVLLAFAGVCVCVCVCVPWLNCVRGAERQQHTFWQTRGRR